MTKQETQANREARIREEAFRAGYGMGGDAYQRERRNRPFLIEDEAWAAFLSGQVPAPAIVLKAVA